jgi:hypothetical protein
MKIEPFQQVWTTLSTQVKPNLKLNVLVNQLLRQPLGTPLDGRGNRALHLYHQREGPALLQPALGYEDRSKNQGRRQGNPRTDVVYPKEKGISS